MFELHMQDTVMLGADYYETDAEIASLLAEGRVPIGIGENTKIRYVLFLLGLLKFSSSLYVILIYVSCRECIIDKNARIGKNVIISNSDVRFPLSAILVKKIIWSIYALEKLFWVINIATKTCILYNAIHQIDETRLCCLLSKISLVCIMLFS